MSSKTSNSPVNGASTLIGILSRSGEEALCGGKPEISISPAWLKGLSEAGVPPMAVYSRGDENAGGACHLRLVVGLRGETPDSVFPPALPPGGPAAGLILAPITHGETRLGTVAYPEGFSASRLPQHARNALDIFLQQVTGMLMIEALVRRGRDSDWKCRTVTESLPVPVVLVSPDGTVRDVNTSLRIEMGPAKSAREFWIGRNFLECLGESYPPLAAPLKDVLSGMTVDLPRVRLAPGGPGTPTTVSFHGAPVSNPAGTQEGALLVVRNVTAQELMESQLAKAQEIEAIGRLAGGIAHDFNNMLTGILGYASLLKTSLPADSEEHEAATYIEKAARRASEMTKQLLAYSRRQTAVARPFNANHVVREAIDILSRSVNKNVRLEADLSAERATILGDHTTFIQALLNMGVNANDAMPDGGELAFRTSNFVSDGTVSIQGILIKEGDYLSIRVSDTGSGIPENLRSKIFEPFFTTKEPGKGTGLGLAMVYGCVKSHNGFIFLDSREGAGTTFTILIPVTGKKEAVIEDPAAAPRAPRGTETVLVVDDEEIPLRLVTDILHSLGYATITASSGEEGLATYKARRDEIGLVILDMIMPGMNGADAMARIRELDPGARLILSSGYNDGSKGGPETLREFDAFLPKPYEVGELARIVRAVLDGKKP